MLAHVYVHVSSVSLNREAFELAVRPCGLAASGSDGASVRARSLRLLEKDCRPLVAASEALVAAVALLLEVPLLQLLLQRMPRLLCRQALMLGLADVQQELVDRECLRKQVRSTLSGRERSRIGPWGGEERAWRAGREGVDQEVMTSVRPR